MKNLFTLVSAAALLFTTVAVNAAELKIGVIDMSVIAQKSNTLKTLREKLAKKFDGRRNKLISLQKSIKSDMDKLGRDASVMSDTAKKDLQGNVMKDRRRLQSLSQDLQQDYKVAERDASQDFAKKMQTVVNKVANDGGYDLVLQRQAISYASKKTDITDKVLKALN